MEPDGFTGNVTGCMLETPRASGPGINGSTCSRFFKRRSRCRPLTPCDPQSGMTLLEVMVAAVVLSVGILALNAMQVSAIRVNRAAGNLTRAVTVGQEWMESLQALPYDHQALGDVDVDDQSPDHARRESLRRPLPPLPSPAVPDPVNYQPEHSSRRGRYRVHWNIEDDLLAPRTKSVSVVVVWREGAVTRSVLLEHVIPEFR